MSLPPTIRNVLCNLNVELSNCKIKIGVGVVATQKTLSHREAVCRFLLARSRREPIFELKL